MEFIEKTIEVQDKIEQKARRLGKGKYGRVLRMARKPTGDEYTKVIEITGAGIILIGGLGFLIYWLWNNFYDSIMYILEV